MRQTIGFTIALIFVVMVVISVASIFFFRSIYSASEELSSEDREHVPLVAAILNAV